MPKKGKFASCSEEYSASDYCYLQNGYAINGEYYGNLLIQRRNTI